MILAVDVYYAEYQANAVGVLFDWLDETPRIVKKKTIDKVEEYIPGSFYKRELPCIVALLNDIDLEKIEAIVIDGYVYIDNEGKYGLGGYLYEYLEKKIPIIGVAKTSFHNNHLKVKEVIRGKSYKPLFVSAIGYDIDLAATHIQNMVGSNRFPDILRKLDNITKTI